MKLFWFALSHASRDLWRNRSRTLFALLCVATGVAAVVALRSLAFMVGDELTTNLAQLNRGDIRLYSSRDVPELVTLSAQSDAVFTPETVDAVREWAASEGYAVTVARLTTFSTIIPLDSGQAVTAQPVVPLFIEPEYYPFYDTIRLRYPHGRTLAEALSEQPGTAADGNDVHAIVISNNLSREVGLGLAVGDPVRLGAAETVFEVRGIAGAEAETILTNPPAAFIGDYVYLPLDVLSLLGQEPLPDQIFIRVPLGRDIAAAEADLLRHLATVTNAETNLAEQLNRASVPELDEQNADIADVIDDLILTLGLTSLLIGGIGIVNTMLVVVSRRTLEIAVLKTLGLKGYRVTFVFLIEAALMGLVGSVFGAALGVVLSYLIRDVGEQAFALSLEWRIYPVAISSGLLLGVLMTVLFGFLPTLIAGQVRPAIVLRPNEAQMPAAGLVQTLATVLIMITGLGILVSAIVEGAIDYGPVYMVVGAGALIGLFGGVIVANTRLAAPMPAIYRFHLPRRFEKLETRLLTLSGIATSWLAVRSRGQLTVQERGRNVITSLLRGLRQLLLAYGAAALGMALASGVMLLLSELLVPLGFGASKPANDVIAAVQARDGSWVFAWLLIAVSLGLFIRLALRAVVGVIALGSVGTTVGVFAGLAGGVLLERALADTGLWKILAEMSTGVVLVEGAVVLLAGVYVLFWLLVWGLGRLHPAALTGLISLTVLMSVMALGLAVAPAGPLPVLVLISAGTVILILYRLGVRASAWASDKLQEGRVSTASGGSGGVLPFAVRSASTMLLSVAAFAVVFSVPSAEWWIGVIGLVLLSMVWWYLQRRYRVDSRLILREMAGRRGRVASTLLGLSVGVAGLALVSLTTGAASHLLEVQLGESAEGNLLIGDPTSQHGAEVAEILEASDGVLSFSQVTTYRGVLIQINGRAVDAFGRPGRSESRDPRENSNIEFSERGIPLGLTERVSLVDLPDYSMENGRALQPGDEGQNRIMIRESFVTDELGLKSGDRLLFLFENGLGEDDDVLLQFRIVGIISRQSEQTGLEEFGNLSVLPPDVLPDSVRPEGIATIAMIDESDDRYMDRVLVALADVPGVVAFELSALTQLAQNLLDQLRAIPTLVAWLALVAGTAIIANTVALTTQERRRQIGVMKAIGVKGRRILTMLVIENGVIGFIAGLLGVGVGFAVTVILVLAGPSPSELQDTLDYTTMVWLILMSIGVSIGAALFSAWSAAAEKPMNVLRYE